MTTRRRRKCRHCGQLFRLDPRNLRHQRYCSAKECRRASKAASQRRWLAKAENRDYFRGPEQMARVRAWRAAHPGYARKKSSRRRALQDGTLEHERCATPSCARGIATMAESIVRASTMGAVEGGEESTVMAKLCPRSGLGEAAAHAPTEPIAALAANTPCKWRPVALEDLAPMPGVGRQTLVRIGATVHQLRQAPWAIRPDTR